MENPKNPKTQKEYCCEMCNYNTSHKNDYSKHLTTAKHKNMCLGNKMDIPGNQKTQFCLCVQIVIKIIILILDYGNTK